MRRRLGRRRSEPLCTDDSGMSYCQRATIVILRDWRVLGETTSRICRNEWNLFILGEGPCSQGASWVACGSRVPPYDFLNLYGIFNSRFCIRNG
jgi:hypothetical protein